MFTQLRNKLLRLIMIITSLMLVVAFVLVFSGMQLSQIESNAQRLSFISSTPVIYISAQEDSHVESTAMQSQEVVEGIAGSLEAGASGPNDAQDLSGIVEVQEHEGSNDESLEPIESTYLYTFSDETVAATSDTTSIYEDSVMVAEFQPLPTFSAYINIEGSEVKLNGIEVFSGTMSEDFYSSLAQRVIEEELTLEPGDVMIHLSGLMNEAGVDWEYAVVGAAQIGSSEMISISAPADDLSSESFEIVTALQESTWVDGGYYQINFINLSEDAASTTTLMVTLIVVAFLMLGVIFVISRYFANRAIKPIEEMWEQQTRFVANASHELKTPLATMMASHDLVMMSPEATVSSQQEWLEGIRGGMDRMQRLITGLLSLAQAEEGVLSPVMEVEATELVSEELDALAEVAAHRCLTVNRELADSVKALVNEDMLREVVKILSENAYAYADEGGTITVALQTAGKQLRLRVSNTGPGISEEDLGHVFERFYRADKARSAVEKPVGASAVSTSGTASDDASTDAPSSASAEAASSLIGSVEHYGLGLSIAKSLVEQMRGTIHAESVPGKMTTFTVLLDL